MPRNINMMLKNIDANLHKKQPAFDVIQMQAALYSELNSNQYRVANALMY